VPDQAPSAAGGKVRPRDTALSAGARQEALLAQKVHSTPITQQAEQSWLRTRREQMTCQSIFPEN
jgi:hypothetical protein